jgi:hypothetical protein
VIVGAGAAGAGARANRFPSTVRPCYNCIVNIGAAVPPAAPQRRYRVLLSNIPIYTLTPRHVAPGDTINIAGHGPATIVGSIFDPNLTLDFDLLEKQAKSAIPHNGDFAVVVSGFTPALLAVLNAASSDSTRIIYFLHWDSESLVYRPQAVYTACLHG